MKAVRPHVDAFVLNLARARTFAGKDFVETREGSCRLASPLTHELTPTMATWARLVVPYAEGVARHLARLAKSGLGITTPTGPISSRERSRVFVRIKPIPMAFGAFDRSSRVSHGVRNRRNNNAARAFHAGDVPVHRLP
jgi:hypothetical protein